MPSRAKKLDRAVAKLPSIPRELVDQFLSGPMSQEAINAAGLAFKQALIEASLSAELSHHLGYPPGAEKPDAATNHRNGGTSKTVLTGDGKMRIETPRDRAGSFEPVLVPKHARRFTAFDDSIVALYARGMTVREIQGYLAEAYGTEVGHDLISTVTDGVLAEVTAWQARPLEPVYAVVFFDALRVKTREDNVVRNKAVYLALGVRRDGTREVLGLWIETTEGAKFWMKVFNDLKTRGVNDILIAVTDGLTGMPAALAAVFPRTTLQTCIVHLIRNSLDYASWKDRKMLAKALRPIYAAASAEAAEAALDAFADGEWGRKFPTVVAAWRRAWAQVIPFFAFPPEIRRVIYTTDEIDKPLVDRIGCFSVRSRRAVFPSRPGSRRRRAQRRSRVILVANSGAQPDQATICRAANCEMRVFAERVPLCHSATLTRLTATAVMTCCKRVFANPM